MGEKLKNVLRAGFFDYAAMLSEIRTPAETAAAVKVLNAILELVGSTGSGDIEFVAAVIEDVLTMVWMAERETGGR